MIRRLSSLAPWCLVVLAWLGTAALGRADMWWSSAPGWVPGNVNYEIAAEMNYGSGAGLSIDLYRDGGYVTSGSGYYIASVSATFNDGNQGQRIGYFSDSYDWGNGNYLSIYTETEIGAPNAAPVPYVSIDGYGYGSWIKRPYGGATNITVRFKAEDFQDNLMWVRANIWHPASGYFINPWEARYGHWGEIIRTVTLDRDGDWYFWTDANDQANAYSSTGDWGNGFRVTVYENRPPDLAFDWVSDATNGGSVSGTGWAADPQDGTNISRIEVFVDGGYRGTAAYGGDRLDVANAYGRGDYRYSGFSFNTGISGLTAGGTHWVTLRAFDHDGTYTETWRYFNVVNTAPVPSISANTTTIYRNQSVTFTVSATDVDSNLTDLNLDLAGIGYFKVDGGPYTFGGSPPNNGNKHFSARGYDAQGCQITFTEIGSYQFVGAAYDGSGWHYSAPITINVVNRQPSTVAYTIPASITNGDSGNFAFSATDPDSNLGYLTVHYRNATTNSGWRMLRAGDTIPDTPWWNDDNTGIIVGTNQPSLSKTRSWVPDLGVGNYVFHLRAIDDSRAQSGVIEAYMTVNKRPQTAPSSQSADILVGQAFIPNYTNGGVGTGETQWHVQGQTGWQTGSWTPLSAGVYTFWVRKAANADYEESPSVAYALNVNRPVINSASAASGTLGAGFSYTITATYSPTSFGASNLPPGLSLNSSTGVISGTPTQVGTFTASVTATGPGGTSAPASRSFTIGKGTPVLTVTDQFAYNQAFHTQAGMLPTQAQAPGQNLPAPTGTVTYSASHNSYTATGGLVVVNVNPFTASYTEPWGWYPLQAHISVTAYYAGDANYNATSKQVTFGAFDTIAPTTPGQPEQVLLGPTSFSVKWTGSTDASSAPGLVYDVSIDGGLTVRQSTSALNASINNVAPSTTYSVKVRAKDRFDNTSGWSAARSITTPASGQDPASDRPWIDVNGDGIRDEIFSAGSAAFTYSAAETRSYTLTRYEWEYTLQTFTVQNNDGMYYFYNSWVPQLVDYDINLVDVRPEVQVLAEPGYEYALYRAASPTQFQRITAPVQLNSGSSALIHTQLLGWWPEESFYSAPMVLVRLGKPVGGLVIDLGSLGQLQVDRSGGVMGKLKLGNLDVHVTGSAATVTLPGGVSVTANGSTVSASGTLPGGYILTAGTNGTGSVSIPGGGTIAIGPNGGSLTTTTGLGVSVSGAGQIGVTVPPGSNQGLAGVLDILGKVAGLGGIGPNVRARVNGGGWNLPGNLDLGDLSVGTHTVDVTTDDRTAPATGNIVSIQWMVAPRTVAMITPAGDPVSAPVAAGYNPSSIPDGANEFTYSVGSPGVLTVKLKAKITGLSQASEIEKARYKFVMGNIGDSSMAWDAANPAGQPTIIGDFIEAKVTYTGLPSNNSAFGQKIARVTYRGATAFDQPFEVFFDKYVANHPGGQANSPNWFFYWMQTPANKTNGTPTIYINATGSHYSFLGAQNIEIGNQAADLGVPAWGSPVGIDHFAWSTAHEAKHRTQLSAFWPTGYDTTKDTDPQQGDYGPGDLLPDAIEGTYMSGRPYNPAKIYTYNDSIGYFGGTPAMIRDSEDIAMRTQTAPFGLDPLWTNGSANASDWANPGKNSKDPQ